MLFYIISHERKVSNLPIQACPTKEIFPFIQHILMIRIIYKNWFIQTPLFKHYISCLQFATNKKKIYLKSRLECPLYQIALTTNNCRISRSGHSLYFQSASSAGSNPGEKKVNSTNKQTNLPLRGKLILFNATQLENKQVHCLSSIPIFANVNQPNCSSFKPSTSQNIKVWLS